MPNSSPMVLRYAVVLAAGVLWVPAAARAIEASELPLRLQWEGPDECGSAARVSAQTASLLREVPADPWAARVRLIKSDDEWQLVLTVRGPISGQRRLRGADCEALTESAALVLSLVMTNPSNAAGSLSEAPEEELAEVGGGELGTPAPTSETDSDSEIDSASETEPDSETDSDPETDSGSETESGSETHSDPETESGSETESPPWPLALRLGVGGDLNTGTLPTIALGGSLGIDLRFGPLRFGASGFVFAPSRGTLADAITTPVPTATIMLVGASVKVCGGGAIQWLELWGCLRGEAGQMFGEGENVDRPQQAAVPWTGVGAELRGLAWLPKRIGLELGVSVGIPVAARNFVLNGQPFHQPAVSFQAHLGLVVALWSR